MHRIVRILLPAVAGLLLLASCNSAPKHTRFIPKDAVVVLGVHTGEMRKELAWSAITGSSLLGELRKAAGSDQVPAMLKDAENSGIDFGSTLYLYSKTDTRFENRVRMSAVLPVADADKLTAYIRKHAPGVAIRNVKGRNEAMIDGRVYIGWNDEALIAMNPIVTRQTLQEPAPTENPDGYPSELQTIVNEVTDSSATMAEMELAFNPAKESAISGNSHFKKLESGDHDITLWVGYDNLLEAYGSQGGVLGVTMGNAMWKGSAMAAGFDFNKGRIDGEMLYYASDSMRLIMKEFGKENVDPDMLKRLPADGLNFAAGYHLSPKAIRMMLDKLGLSGMANLALMQKGMSVDDILGAFTGDMAMSLNNFRMETKMQEIDSATQRDFGLTPQPVTSPDMDFVYAMKIADKAKMDKLISFITSSEMLKQTAPNTYTIPMSPDGPTLVVGDKYVAVSSKTPGAQAFLSEKASTVMPEAVKEEIAGHPAGLWADIRSFMSGAGALASGTASDSAAYNTVRNLFTTLTAHGGEYKGNASEYRMSLGFVNKEEHSLVQLLHLAQKLALLNNSEEVAMH